MAVVKIKKKKKMYVHIYVCNCYTACMFGLLLYLEKRKPINSDL
uniref:Uncharacterized protein n=1 Tax=Anguilla anguilla TaxID=7936 RepID=A0A0E9WYT7_ANGAN